MTVNVASIKDPKCAVEISRSGADERSSVTRELARLRVAADVARSDNHFAWRVAQLLAERKE